MADKSIQNGGSDQLNINLNENDLADVNEKEELGKPRVLITRELARMSFSLLLGALLVFTVIFTFVKHDDWDTLKEILRVILPVETALLGSAFGFYFGKSNSDS